MGRATLASPVEETARDIRERLVIGSALNGSAEDWDEALRRSMENIENAGILVNRTGFAGGSTKRKLSVDEFRGFALCDKYAPLIFVNGVDIPAAQMFTLAHEIAHIWIGESAVFNLDRTYSDFGDIETYCNRVAAEVLVPIEEITRAWRADESTSWEIERLAKKFKVSRVVIARRAQDAGFMAKGAYHTFYNKEVKAMKKAGGGNYYLAKPYQASRRFSVAVIRDAKNGKTLFRDAMHLLGIKTHATFEKYANSLQIDL